MTLFLHEVHRVAGEAEDEFNAAYRDAGGWMDRLAQNDDARLLYFLEQAHGTGPSYRVVTFTAVADANALDRLSTHLEWAERTVGPLRHGASSKILLPVGWSPLQDVDLASVPTSVEEHDTSLFMEDTGWPDSSQADYIEFWGRDYYPMLARQPEAGRLLEIQACFEPAFGTGRRKEAILWQRVHNLDRLLELLVTEVPPERKAAGTYMATALTYRDQWESRLLRTAAWSPWW